jgi:hypothetical protein
MKLDNIDISEKESLYDKRENFCLSQHIKYRINYNIEIVVSRYNNNTDWTKYYYDIHPCIIKIYDKNNSENPYNIPVNKGNEASVYLKYIIDHYNNLPDYIFFIHDEEYSWHHKGSIIERFIESLIEVYNKDIKYKNINSTWWDINSHSSSNNIMKSYWDWYSRYIETFIPKKSLRQPIWINKPGSAQFIVHRNRIIKFPIEFYYNIYNWIISTSISSYESGRYLEYTWHIFWEN